MTKSDRLKQSRAKSGLSQQELAVLLGVSQAYINGLENGKPFSLKKAKLIGQHLKVDPDWLYFGSKNIVNAGSNENITYKENVNQKATKNKGLTFSDSEERGSFYQKLPNRQSEEIQFVGVPMYNIPASASLVEMYGDANDVKIVGHLTIPGATKNSFALPVHGHSMYPTLENGSWCVLRPLSDPTDIEWGEIYYIEYGDYRMYKRLLKADEDDSVVLWSDNQSEVVNNKPKYAAKTIKKEKIRRLCLLTDILKKPNY